MAPMRFSVPAIVALVAVALVGCQGAKPIGGVARNESNTKRAVVSLSPGTSELMYQLSFNRNLKGRTDADDWPTTISKVPVVVHNTKIDYEMLAGIKPDLIVYDANLYSDAEVEKLKQTGATLMPFKATDLRGYEDYIRQLSFLMGGETNASEYIDKVYAASENAKAGVGGAEIKTMVLDGGNGGELSSPGTGSFVASEVKAAGGDFMGPKGDRWVPVNVEEIIAGDPDIIFCPVTAFEAVSKDPRLANVKAVKNKKVLSVDPDLLFRAGSRVDKLISALGAEIQRVASK